jgi:dienelactone hydrolase
MRKSHRLPAVALIAALLPPTAAGALGLQWLGGDTVEVAAQRSVRGGGKSEGPLLGYLARPEAPGRHPAVVVLHGCGGFGTNDVVAADVLKSYGYVALALDSLGDEDSCGKPGSSLAEAEDARLALDWLAQQGFVGPDRVAVLGFSMGATATLDTVATGERPGSNGRQFRAAVAFYPRCRQQPGPMAAPTLILIGDRDNWTLLSWCQEMMTRRAGKGAPVDLAVYPGATHAFNVPSAPRQSHGHHLEYDPQATADAWQRVHAFLQAQLKR